MLVSNVVRELCASRSLEFTSVGEATLNGFDEPVALYEGRSESSGRAARRMMPCEIVGERGPSRFEVSATEDSHG